MTHWDRSLFDGDLQALLDVRPPVPISRINALRDLALAHREHLNYITQRILRFLETSPPDYRVAGLYLIDAIIRKPKDQQAECAVNDYRLRFQAVLRDHALQGLFSLCSEEDKARVIRVFTYWGEKHIFPKHFAEQLKIDAIYEPNEPSRQPTVIPNHNVADENLQQTLQTPFPTIPNNPTDLTHFLASLQTTATNQTELSHYPPALHHFLQGLQLGAHLPAIALNGALPSLFQPPPPPPSQQPAPYATTDLPGMQQTYTNTTFDDKSAVKYECIQDEVVPSCQIALQQAQSHSPSPSLSVPTSSTTATDHDMVPVKQEPLAENEAAVVESTQSTPPQHPPSSSTSIPQVTAASSPSPAKTPPLPAQSTPTTSVEPVMASTAESNSMSLPIPSPKDMLSPKQSSPQPQPQPPVAAAPISHMKPSLGADMDKLTSISTTPNPPLSEAIPPPKTPPLPPIVKEEHVVPAISMDIAESQSLPCEDTSTNEAVKRPLSPPFESKDEDAAIDSSQTIDNNAKRQRLEKDEFHDSSDQSERSASPTRKRSRWDVKKDEVARPKTPPLPRPKTPPLPQETTATAPTTEVVASIGPDSTGVMEVVVQESTTLQQQQESEKHVQQQQDDRMSQTSKSSNSTPSNAVSSPHSAHVIMNKSIPRPKTPPSPPASLLLTHNGLTSIPTKSIPRPKTPPLPTQATEDALQYTKDDHSQSKSTKRHHSPSPSIDDSRQMRDMTDSSEGSRQQPPLDNASPSNKRRKKTSNDDNMEDTRSKPKISSDESKLGKELSREDNKATLAVKKSSKENESSSTRGRSTSSSPTTKGLAAKEGSSSSTKHSKEKEPSSSSPTTKHSKGKEASSSTRHSKEREASSSTRHSKEKEAAPSTRHSKEKDKTARSHESSSRPSTTSRQSTSERSSTSKSNERSHSHPSKSSEKSSSNARSNEPSRSSRDSNHKHPHKERSQDDTSERHRSERHSHYRTRDASPSRQSHKDEDRGLSSPNTYYPPQLYSPSAPTATSTLSPFARPGPLADSRLKKGFIRVMTRTMYVGPMPSDVEEEDIRDLFSQYGEILSISFNDRPDKKRNAFVQFGNRDSLTAAKEGSQNLRMGGKPVTVNWAHGFGPKALYSYEKGDTVIKLDELTKEEAALLRSAPVGGFQGSRMRDQVIVEEPGPLGGRQSTLHQPRRQPSASPQSEHRQQSYASPTIQSTPPSHHHQSPIHPPTASSMSQPQQPQYHEVHYPPESYHHHHHHPQAYNGYYPAVASPSSANPPVDPYQNVKFEQVHDYDVAQPAYTYPYYSGPHHYPPPPPPQTSAPPPPVHPSYYQHPYPYPEQDPNMYYQQYYYQQQPSPQQPPHSNPYYYGYHDGYR
ncbi:predicted protein [Lichtheimia corymbifera JMRC:FSU:9682]|uniref:Uncharacterized protein n=1 Tax=Lichtheimia corymbifera JMRC:FSU:9682 TaxID=1263082 RepID=A0A068RKH7_9FUNG|nr:predicted protein [Lichtheimia corymbifera JMRC:FSU:9682]